MRSLLILPALALLAGCNSAPNATEQKLAEAIARAETAEKKLAAIAPATPVPEPPKASEPKAPEPKAPEPAKPAAAPAPIVRTIPAGTALVVRTTSLLSTKTVQANSAFVAHLEQPLMVGGTVVAPRGSAVTGVVTQTDPGGRIKGKASLSVRLTEVAGRRIATSSVTQVARSGVKGDMVKTGIGSGIGAAIGAIAGGGKGAAIGAGAGAGGGAGVVLATRGPAAEIAPESVLRFTLARPLVIR
jgi:hypothetical protein